MTDEQDKLIFLDNCLDDDFCTDRHFALLKALSHDADEYVRSQVACTAVNFVCEGVKELLLQLVDDDDPLVRAEACDSLSCYPDEEVEAFLRDAIPEECDPLARSYAILSWADVSTALCLPQADGLTQALQWQNDERHAHCRLSLCYARHRFADETAWKDMLAFLKHADYHLRCAALSLLGEIEDTARREAIEAAVREMLLTETTVAVRSAAERFFGNG